MDARALFPCSGSSLRPRWLCPGLVVLLILGSAGLRIAYLVCNCPLDLAPDEAHYWEWSRHLDWSYYSKGPLVAYLIRAACGLTGSWFERLTGSEMPAVRLPAVMSGSLLLLSVYVLTRQVYGRERLALAAVAVALTLPALSVLSSLMTIDAPYTCCWGWALVLGYQAVLRRSAWAWPAAGLIIGVGILAKYTMILWIPSLGLFLLSSKTHRRALLQPGFWTMTAVAAACCLPILIWNARQGWISFWHVHRLAGLSAGNGVHWLGPVAYLGAQCGAWLGFWFVAWVAAMIAHRPPIEPRDDLRYLWWMSLPVFAVFLLFSFKTGGGEPNWPVAAYISGLVLALGWVVRQLQSPRTWYRRSSACCLVGAGVLGMAVNGLMYDTAPARPLLQQLSGPPTAKQPLPLRRLDPTCRLRGWRTLAAEIDHLRAQMRHDGVEPIVAAANWSLPGELGFYCEGHPKTYSIGLAIGDRRSQYDFWRPNPVQDVPAFQGQTFILVGSHIPCLTFAFDQVGEPRDVVHYENGQPVAWWQVTVCRGFRGFPPATPTWQPPY